MEQPYTPPPSAPPPRRGGALRWIVLGLLGVMLLQLCALAGLFTLRPTLRNTALGLVGLGHPPAPPAAPEDNARAALPRPLNLQESFDAPTDRWDQSLTELVNGAYELRIGTPNLASYGLYLGSAVLSDTETLPSQIADLDLAVDVQQTAGDPSAEYGIRFRQTGPGDYLMYAISGTGFYRLLRVENGAYTDIVPWTFDRRIKTGLNATNRLHLRANGSDITLSVNDVQLARASDSRSSPGQLAFGATTFANGGLLVRFDNPVGSAGSNTLDEDFGNAANVRWSLGGAQIVDNTYELITSSGVTQWQEPLPLGVSRVKNFVLEVDMTLVSPNDDASYGLLFGDTSSYSFYSLLLLPQGGLTMTRGNQTLIDPTRLSAIKVGANQTNHLRLEINNQTMTIAINGTNVGELPAPDDTEGQVGMVVGNSGSGQAMTQVRFDNFHLEELP